MFRFWFLAFITNLMPTAFRSLICTWQLHAPTTSLVYIQAYSLYVWNSGTFMCALLLAWKKENGMMHASGREKWTDQWHHRSWKRSGARTRQWGQGRKVTRWDSQARFWWRPGSTGIKKCETIRLISPRPQRWNEMKPSISGEWIIWPSEPCDDALRIHYSYVCGFFSTRRLAARAGDLSRYTSKMILLKGTCYPAKLVITPSSYLFFS